MFDIVVAGEYLIDFTPSGRGSMGNPAYEMNPGGGPPNCAAAVSALGGKSAVIGAVGDDLFGRFLKQTLTTCKIEPRGVQTVPVIHTTLAFVSLQDNGEREFAFLRDPGADTELREELLDYSLIDQCRNLHFSSLTLKRDPARAATLSAVRYAKERGIQVSYDPNYRAMLWDSREQAIRELYGALPLADVVKLSEEEMAMLLHVSADDPASGANKLLEMGIKTCYITYGAKGAYYATASEQGFVDGFPVRAVDTTGCGDAFMGASIFLQFNHPEYGVRERVQFANAVGALCATKKGGMMAMPSYEQALNLFESR